MFLISLDFNLTFFTSYSRFKRMKLLRVHMRTHTQFPSIPCPICGKLFRRNCQRDTHIKERHGVPAPKRVKKPPAPPKKPLKKFTCELCVKLYSIQFHWLYYYTQFNLLQVNCAACHLRKKVVYQLTWLYTAIIGRLNAILMDAI